MNRTCKFFIVLIMLAFMPTLYAAIPDGYYDTAAGKSGSALQNALSTIIGNKEVGYKNLWDVYRTSDRRDDGKVWDMYSSTTNYTFGTDQCGNYKGEGSCYNREHSVPKSWIDGSDYSDAHIVVPSDGYVNNRRSSMPFGEVGSSSYTSNGGFSKVGTCSVSGYSGEVFEPNDEYKGDFARIYFYTATRFTTRCGSFKGDGASVFSGSFPYLDKWALDMMLRWHRQDPVSDKEIKRNDAVYAEQNNRNPFVDYPELVDLIFGTQTSTPFYPGETKMVYIETPEEGMTIDFGTALVGSATTTAEITIKGYNLTGSVTLSMSGGYSSYFKLSQTSLSAASVNEGAELMILYNPVTAGSHNATLSISGGGLGAAHSVNLIGSAVEGFAATNATEMRETSFVANWTAHSQANDYELAVWSMETSQEGETKMLLDTDFLTDYSGWTTSGYTNGETQGLRLASNGSSGSVTSPAVDMSGSSLSLTVNCAPYNKDESSLEILVDGKSVGAIDCKGGEVTETVTLASATAESTLTLKAGSGKRVYLKHVTLQSGGGATTQLVDGYPRRVGNVQQYRVTGLSAEKEYFYRVTAYKDNSSLAESETIEVKTMASAVSSAKAPEGMYVYSYNGAIYVDGAPANARMSYYSLDGRLCGTRTLHAVRESIVPLQKGIYVVRIVTAEGCFSSKVAIR